MINDQVWDTLTGLALALFVGGSVAVTLIMSIVGLYNAIKEYFKKHKK